MRRKQKVKISIIVSICLIAAFFIGYFSSAITMVSWKVFLSKPIASWFEQQNAVFFAKDDVDIVNIQAFNKIGRASCRERV